MWIALLHPLFVLYRSIFAFILGEFFLPAKPIHLSSAENKKGDYKQIPMNLPAIFRF